MQETSVRVPLLHADWVITGLMKPTWVEAARRLADPPSITDALLANCFHRLLIDARCSVRCSMSPSHRRQQSQGHRTRAVYSHRNWDAPVCDSVVSVTLGATAGTLLLNSGCETTSHELAVCESDSRCSTWITTSGSALLILTSAKQTSKRGVATWQRCHF